MLKQFAAAMTIAQHVRPSGGQDRTTAEPLTARLCSLAVTTATDGSSRDDVIRHAAAAATTLLLGSAAAECRALAASESCQHKAPQQLAARAICLIDH